MQPSTLIKKVTSSMRYMALFIGIVVVFLGMGFGIVLLLARHPQVKTNNGQTPRLQAEDSSLNLSATQTLTVNAQLQVNGGFYLVPQVVPKQAQTGSIIFDKVTNTLQYYNGKQFVAVVSQDNLPKSTPAGVTSLQGQTGAVVLTPGAGISINGVNVSNSGILGINGVAGDVNVTTANGIASISLPQPVGPTASPTFNALTLATALNVANGGTGAATLTDNGVVVAHGTGAFTSVKAVSAGLCLVSTSGSPTWGVCSGGGVGVATLNGLMGSIDIANATAAGSIITIDDASTSNKGIAQFNGTNFSTLTGVVNTIQDIAINSTPTFAGLNLTSPLPIASGGTGANNATSARSNLGAAARGANGDITSTTALNTITPSAALTVGASGFAVTIQGSSASTFKATNGSFTTTLGFATPTANATINLPALTAGTYEICTSSGNCLGGGTGGANTSLSNLSSVALNTALLPGSTTIDLGSVSNAFRDLYIGGSATNNFRFTGTASAPRIITVPDAGGTICLSTGNCIGGGGGAAPNGADYLTLSSNATLSAERVLTAGTNITFTDGGANSTLTIATSATPSFTSITLSTALSVANGGTGTNTFTSNGLLYGNGTSAIQVTAAGATGECLTGNTGAAPTWSACSSGSGVTAIGAINSQTKSANGAVISGSSLYLQTADASNPGLVSTGTQTFAGAKTFGGNATFQSSTVGVGVFQIQNSSSAPLFSVDNNSSPNQITGGNFETGITGWTAKSSATLSQGSGNMVDGNYSLQVATAASANSGASYSVNMSGSTLYRLTFYARVGSGSASSFEFGYGTSGTDTSCSAGNTLNINWQYFNCSFTTASSLTSPYVYMKQTDSTARNIYIDRVSLTASTFQQTYNNGGAIQLLTNINSPLTIQPRQDAPNIFQILNSGGNAGLSYDSTGDFLTIGSTVTASTLNISGTYITGNNGLSVSATAGLNLNTTVGSVAIGNSNSGSVTLQSAGNIVLGTSNTTGTLLVLDTKTDAGDPTGVNGGMYYNSNAGKLRCYQNSSWVDCIAAGASGITTIGALNGGTANATGATISGSTLYLQSASASYAGVVDTTTQSFAGDKTFIGNLSAIATFTLQTSSNNYNAFQILNSSGNSILNVDTTIARNLITNGSFENVTTGWSPKLGASLSINGSYQVDGNASMIVSNSATANMGTQYNYSLAGSQTYSFSFYARQISGSFSTMQIGYSNDGSTDTSCATGQVVTGSWLRFSCTFTMSSSVSGTRYVYIKQTDAASRVFAIDRAQLETGSVVSAYSTGSIQLIGGLNSPLALQLKQDSREAVDIRTAAGISILTVDSLNSSVSINGASSGSTNALTVSNNASTGNILTLQDSATPVFTVYDGGAIIAKNQTDSTSGFVVQRAGSGGTLFTIDTSTTSGSRNGMLYVGESDANATLLVIDTKTGAGDPTGVDGAIYYNSNAGKFRCYQAGAWTDCVGAGGGGGGTRRITLVPEFPGGVITADGSNNSGTMTSDFCSGSARLNLNASVCASSSDERNYYTWTTSSGTNDYDVYVSFRVPSDFTAFASSSTITGYGWRTSSSELVEMAMFRNGTQCGTTTNLATSNTAWTQTALGGDETTCSVAANDMIVFRIKLTATAGNYARLGEINFDYTASF